jgi:hypothetical protein
VRVISSSPITSLLEKLTVVLPETSTIWPSALGLGLLVVVIVGVVVAARLQRQRVPRGHGGSVTDWGQDLALIYELRREIKRLTEENQRLWQEQAELVKMSSRIVEFLQQPVGQVSRKFPGPK